MSQNKNIFNEVQAPKVRKSGFDMGNTHVTACNFGEMIPVYVQPTLPGSFWKMSTEWLVKTAPLIAPVMHRNQVYVHTFYVPYRILWDNWENFITETKVAGVLPAVPFFNINADAISPADEFVTRLHNYLGIPFPADTPGAGGHDVPIQAFWFAAYQKIWSEYYRDENLQPEFTDELIDGDNTANIGDLDSGFRALRKRAWMHDYFTSALPDTQKGDPVNIPMTFEDVPVTVDASGGAGTVLTGTPDNIPVGQTPVGQVVQAMQARTSLLVGDAAIIDLRTAEQLQKFRETMMTHGSRYNEFLQAIYGYKINDSTVQRPVYLGGMRADLMISETLATTQDPAINQPQGNKSGNAQSYGNGGNIEYMCPEHGVIMTILTVMPDSMYYQGIPKEFLKLSDPFEFGNPLMANIGEQPILNKEIFAYRTANLDEATFGYQMRYAEYKQTFNRISSDMTSSLIFWNEARAFASLPALNGDFIVCDHANDDLARIFNVEDAAEQKLWVMIRTNAYVQQPLPYFGTPMLG